MKDVIGILVLLAVIGGVGYFVLKNLPQTTVQTGQSHEFVLNKPFEVVMRRVSDSRFEREMLEANNAVLISEEWIDMDFHIENLFRPDRRWEFQGRLLAKVQVDHPDTGRLVVELVQDLIVASDKIDVQCKLYKPIHSLGVTELRDHLYMVPQGENQTLVRVNTSIKVQRYIPVIFKDYAQRLIDTEARNSCREFETVMRRHVE